MIHDIKGRVSKNHCLFVCLFLSGVILNIFLNYETSIVLFFIDLINWGKFMHVFELKSTFDYEYATQHIRISQ